MCHYHVKFLWRSPSQGGRAAAASAARQIGGAWAPTSAVAGIERGRREAVGWMMERGNKRGGGLGVWTAKEAEEEKGPFYGRSLKETDHHPNWDANIKSCNLPPRLWSRRQMPHLSRCLCWVCETEAWAASILWPIIYALLHSYCRSKSILSRQFNVGCSRARVRRQLTNRQKRRTEAAHANLSDAKLLLERVVRVVIWIEIKIGPKRCLHIVTILLCAWK